VLHLCGFDHETDEGDMLEVQDLIMSRIEQLAEAADG
jgi:ssRNA-specific RNase YbeY (16S rRNA maturation enzyme)